MSNRKPAGAAARGQPDHPIYARTSVLCNGQIVWKVRGEQELTFSETDPEKADLRSPADAIDDLNALNGLQFKRNGVLQPIELKQPLRHVQSSLPKPVKSKIYTGDLYGSMGDVFSCPPEEFATRCRDVFGNELRADGNMNYNDFFRRLRRSEWLLWDVQPEKGHWVVVVAHLHKSVVPNPNKKNFSDNANIPAFTTSPDFNMVDAWCIISPERKRKGDALVQRVETRLEAVLRQGRIGIDQEQRGSVWVPTTRIAWTTGLHAFNIIKTFMHRITELHCRQQDYDESFWDPLPGWLNVDDVRAEMQGRAAQRCMVATGYRSRIAIEGVRRYIGWKEIVRANELRPRHRDHVAFRPGLYGRDGYGIPATTGLPEDERDDVDSLFGSVGSGDDIDNTPYEYKGNKFEGPLGTPPPHVEGWNSDEDSDDYFREPLSYPKAQATPKKVTAMPTPVTTTKAPPKKATPKKPAPVMITPAKTPARAPPSAPVKATTQNRGVPLRSFLSSTSPVSPTPSSKTTLAKATTPALAGNKKRRLDADSNIGEAENFQELIEKRLAQLEKLRT
ncbi:hypothetical protein F5Y08DRAFT_336795 [Xylaria arbuscula]|nr:hypothetical protein F5Y08DRAFT_336795 [Xylaria arbuscula]